jgi:chaperonin cofactor prefoldin
MASNVVNAVDRFRSLDSIYEPSLGGGSGNGGGGMDTRIAVLEVKVDDLKGSIDQSSKKIDIVDARLISIEKRADVIDSRLTSIEKRVDVIDSRLTSIEKRVDVIDSRLATMDKRMDRLENRMDGLDSRMDSLTKEVHAGFSSMSKEMTTQSRWMAGVAIGLMASVIGTGISLAVYLKQPPIPPTTNAVQQVQPQPPQIIYITPQQMPKAENPS